MTDAAAVVVTYHADREPDTGLPPLVGPGLVQRQTAEQFSAMLREMMRRQQQRAGGAP